MYKSTWTEDNLSDDKRILLIKTVEKTKSQPFKGLSKEEKNEHFKKGERFFIENKDVFVPILNYGRGRANTTITQIIHCVSDKLILLLKKMFARNEDPQTTPKIEIPIEDVVYYYKRTMAHFNVRMKCIMIGNAILKKKRQYINGVALKTAREMVAPLFACSNNSNNASIILKSSQDAPLMFDFALNGILNGHQLPNFIINTTKKITKFITKIKGPKVGSQASTSSPKRARPESFDEEPSPKVLVLPSHKEVRFATSARTSITPTCSSSIVPEIEIENEIQPPIQKNDNDQQILQHANDLDKIFDDKGKRILRRIIEIKNSITKLYLFVEKAIDQTRYFEFLKESKAMYLFHDAAMMTMLYKRQEFDLEQFIGIIDILKKHLFDDIGIISKLINEADNEMYKELTKNFATVLAKSI